MNNDSFLSVFASLLVLQEYGGNVHLWLCNQQHRPDSEYDTTYSDEAAAAEACALTIETRRCFASTAETVHCEATPCRLETTREATP